MSKFLLRGLKSCRATGHHLVADEIDDDIEKIISAVFRAPVDSSENNDSPPVPCYLGAQKHPYPPVSLLHLLGRNRAFLD